MKHIKTYEILKIVKEIVNHDKLIKKLAKHLFNFLSKISDNLEGEVKMGKSKYYRFYYDEKSIMRNLFAFEEYAEYFDIRLDSNVYTNSETYVSKELFDAIIFIYQIIVKHERDRFKIEYSEIPSIIEEITLENFELQSTAKKYNL